MVLDWIKKPFRSRFDSAFKMAVRLGLNYTMRAIDEQLADKKKTGWQDTRVICFRRAIEQLAKERTKNIDTVQLRQVKDIISILCDEDNWYNKMIMVRFFELWSVEMIKEGRNPMKPSQTINSEQKLILEKLIQ